MVASSRTLQFAATASEWNLVQILTFLDFARNLAKYRNMVSLKAALTVVLKDERIVSDMLGILSPFHLFSILFFPFLTIKDLKINKKARRPKTTPFVWFFAFENFIFNFKISTVPSREWRRKKCTAQISTFPKWSFISALSCFISFHLSLHVAINSDVTACSSLVLCVRKNRKKKFHDILKQFVVIVTQQVRATYCTKKRRDISKRGSVRWCGNSHI
jgi:hypothetical protein